MGLIRCRHCGGRAAAELTVCPNCGRELKSAPPRVLTWGIPVALVAIFLALIIRQVDGSDPLSWAQDRLTVEGFPARTSAQRGVVVIMTPVGNDDSSSEAVATQNIPDDVALATITTVSADGVVTEGLVSPEITVVDSVGAPPGQAQITRVEVETPVEAATAVSSPAVSDNPPELAADAVDAVVTAPDAVAPEPEDGTTVSVVESPIDGAASTAVPEDSPVEEDTITAAASDGGDEVVADEAASESTNNRALLVSSASAQEPLPAVLPSATATLSATATPEPTATVTPTPTTAPTETATYQPMPEYEVRRGDTLVVIARKHDVTVEKLMQVNGITAAEAFTIQPGQDLLIPVEGSVGAQDPTATPTSTSAPTAVVPPTATPMPTPTEPAVRLDAPLLRSPEPGTPVSCASPSSLAWLPVPFMRSNDTFVLHLGFVGGRTEDGRDIVVWVLEQPRPATATSWDVDGGLCSYAPQEYGRKWHWYVEVAENNGGVLIPVSPPSETWYFTWN